MLAVQSETNYQRVSTATIGNHRGSPRVYLEGEYLLSADFLPTKLIEATFRPGRVTLRLSEQGTRRVSQKAKGRPVIDINSRALRDAFGDAETLQVIVRSGEIILTPLRTEERRRRRCRNGKEGSLFSGGGLFTKAAQLAGFKPGFAVELNPDYARVYEQNFPDALMFNMSVADVPLDELPEVEILTIGIPCEVFSNLRTTTRGTGQKRDRSQVPEAQHIDADLTMWAALIIERVNPATVIIEEAKEWLNSGAGWMMRHFLTRLGYSVDARVIDAVEYGELMNRRRSVMIATSDTEINWPREERTARRLGDIFDTPEEVEGTWFDADSKAWLFRHWTNQRAKGNGFEAVKVTAESATIKTITKRYLSGQGDGSVIAHDSEPGVCRWFSLAEIRRLFGVPESFILPSAKTTAGEVIAQGVIVTLFQKIIETATGRAEGVRAGEPESFELESAAGQLALAF